MNSCNLFKFKSKPLTPREIKAKAIKLGVDDKTLTTTMGGISTNYYDLLLRIRSEEACRVSRRAQFFSIISVVVTIISTLYTIYASR